MASKQFNELPNRAANAVRRVSLVATFAVAMLGTTAAQAFISLGLTGGTPDIVAQELAVIYMGNNDSGTLTADNFGGFAGFSVIEPPGTPMGDISDFFFHLDAAVDFNDSTATGNLTLSGDVAGLGLNGVLLVGTLNSTLANPTFGTPGGESLEFLFEVTGGLAAGLFGDTAGVILSNSGYMGSFDEAFGEPENAAADTFGVVPAPGTLLLLAGGLMLFARRRTQGSSASQTLDDA